MSLYSKAVLECQDCGMVLRHLSPEEVSRVTKDPYSYIVYCKPCGATRLNQLARRERAERSQS